MTKWFLGTVVNPWLFLGIVLGVGFRIYGGQVISVTTGLAFGILLVEALKFGVWFFSRG